METEIVLKHIDPPQLPTASDELRELGELQLALVGGGIGETAL